jgi:hypothetical protein
MYIAREYMHFLLGPHGPKGPKGGTIINPKNSPRYLNNTEFAAGVRSGWIGSMGSESTLLADVVRQYLESNDAIYIAREAGIEQN